MSARQIQYYERHSGLLRTEPVFAARLLFWSYDTYLGRAIGQFLLRQPLLSRAYAWLNRRRFSRRRIAPFAKAMCIELSDCLRPLAAYDSFCDFFIREIDLQRRPIDPDPRACVTPADGRVYVLPQVEARHSFCIKGGRFTLADFLADEALTRRYAGGAMAIVRLHLADYHHFHFPVAGIAGPPRRIPGRLHAVGPYARRWPIPFFGENRRMLTQITTRGFGVICMAEIGACTVGSIRQTFDPRTLHEKGARKGYFELGGSTVVLLFEPGAVAFDEDLLEHSAAGMETYLRLGERLGSCQ
jgi:phosphatidylserine decarboxylase